MKSLSFFMFSLFNFYLLVLRETVKCLGQSFIILVKDMRVWKKMLFSLLIKNLCFRRRVFHSEEGDVLFCFAGRRRSFVREFVYPLLMKMFSVFNGLCN